jgi:hypothetical protein
MNADILSVEFVPDYPLLIVSIEGFLKIFDITISQDFNLFKPLMVINTSFVNHLGNTKNISVTNMIIDSLSISDIQSTPTDQNCVLRNAFRNTYLKGIRDDRGNDH